MAAIANARNAFNVFKGNPLSSFGGLEKTVREGLNNPATSEGAIRKFLNDNITQRVEGVTGLVESNVTYVAQNGRELVGKNLLGFGTEAVVSLAGISLRTLNVPYRIVAKGASVDKEHAEDFGNASVKPVKDLINYGKGALRNASNIAVRPLFKTLDGALFDVLAVESGAENSFAKGYNNVRSKAREFLKKTENTVLYDAEAAHIYEPIKNAYNSVVSAVSNLGKKDFYSGIGSKLANLLGRKESSINTSYSSNAGTIEKAEELDLGDATEDVAYNPESLVEDAEPAYKPTTAKSGSKKKKK